MEIRIRKSKHQKEEMTVDQFIFASERVSYYIRDNLKLGQVYHGCIRYPDCQCDVYRTKTTISAIVYFK